MKQEKFRLKYIPALDGLRGVAIISVMGFHAHAPFLKGGFVGVDVFFALSGFLITSLLVSEYDRFGFVSLKNFYMRRVLRLTPALLVLLLVVCLSSFFLLNSHQAKQNYLDCLISLLYLSNWARAFAWHPPDLLGHTWSLSIEEQFYIIWPILLLAQLRFVCSRKVVVALTSIIACSSCVYRICLHANGATVERLYNGLDTRLDALMVGCALGVAYASGFFATQSRRYPRSVTTAFLAIVSSLILLFFLFVANWRSPYMYQIGFSAISVLTAVIVVDVIANEGRSVIGVFLGTGVLVSVGRISYGLYLWHYPVYEVLFRLGMSGYVVITVGSLLTFAIAAMSYLFIEKPILKLKTRFTSDASC